MSLTVFIIVAATAAIHALFGVGLLLFGTPILLLLGYDYFTILQWLLPIALGINLLQIWLHASQIDWNFVRSCALFSLPTVLACSLAMAQFNLAIGPLMGVLLILVAIQRFSATAQQALTQVMQQTALYCIVMGTVQGLTSLGGSLLSALVHSKGYDKNRARVTTAATYALFLTVQLIALLRTAPSNEGHAGDLFTLAAIGLGTFALIEHTLYAALDRERYQAVLTGFLFVSGLLLIGKSLFL
ncbi:MAG: hypothetical protein U0412_06465 [Nitrospira sp.]